MENRIMEQNFFQKYLSAQESAWVDKIWQQLDEKRLRAAHLAYDKLPYTTNDGVYSNCRSWMWTNGFWPGMMWLMYVGTGKQQYRKTAENAEDMISKTFETPWELCHDAGFMWRLSSGVNYTLFKNEKSKARVLLAADHLAARFNCRGRYIHPGNKPEEEGDTIIDTMMNLSLLYLATELTQNKRYAYIAQEHADHIMQSHLRPDGSVRHVVVFDPESGDIVGYKRGQGYSEDSAWARGQTWAIYGFTLSYIHTGKKEYLDAAKRAANFFIAAIGDSYLPRVDLLAPAPEHDTTAGAIGAGALLELARCAGEWEKPIYINAALKILHALEENYCDWSAEEEAIVMHGIEGYHPEERRLSPKSIIYGDYFFTEALYKLKGFGPLFW